MSTVTAHDFPEIRWRGHWIWVPEDSTEAQGWAPNPTSSVGPEAHGLFRRTFDLDHVADRVPARLTADSRYVLFVNGQEVCRGPIRSQPRRLSYDLVDLAPYLRPGVNAVAVHVKYYGQPTSHWMPAAANLRLGKTGILVFEANLGEAGWLTSDASWRAKKADAWSDEWRGYTSGPSPDALPIEVFDARGFTPGWQAADFDDSSWGDAQIVPATHIGGFARSQPPTDPYGPLLPRPIGFLDGQVRRPVSVDTETVHTSVDTSIGNPVMRVAATIGQPATPGRQQAGLPLRLESAAGPGVQRIIVDMGVVVSGFVQLELDAPSGTAIDVCYAEEPLRPIETMIRMEAGTRYIARGHDDRFEVFDSNGFRYAYILVHGPAAGAVSLQSFAVREHVYPWQPGAAFECDDPLLNRLFTAGVRTVQLCSHDAFIDCPTREQRAWVGDSVVHQMVHLATNRDWRLAWHWLELANSPRSDGILPMSVAGDIEAGAGLTIPDWALHWLHGMYNRYRFDGNQEAIKALMPSAERVLRWYVPYQASAGVLKDVVEWNLVDWSSVSNEDTSAVLTAICARGLREFAELAGWLEERASQRWAQAVYERAKAGFEMFWDERRGSYVDHVKHGERQPEMSQLAGALAIVSGLAPQSRWGRIIDTITEPSRLVVRSWTGGGEGEYSTQKIQNQLRGVYTIDWDAERQVVLAEPFMSYVVHDAVAQSGRADLLPDLYGRWSQFLENGYDTIGECWGWGTHAHGWSCTPTRDMLFYTLGITPADAGYTSARVAPRLGRLQWARGKVPSPRGLITVEASREHLTIDSPVPVLVDLPDQPVRKLAEGRHELDVRAPAVPTGVA